nr:MBL fold metallo-hydrolase [Cellulomonas sp. APG4]
MGASCHVVGDDGGPAVVVDPGLGVTSSVLTLVREAGLDVRAVLITHGHVDHTWDAAPLSERLGVPVHVHARDRHRLADPFGTLGPLGAELARAASADPGAEYREPSDVRVLDVVEDEAEVTFAAPGATVTLRALHAPGHTEGSTVYLLRGRTSDAVVDGPVALTGDVLFARSIGRTDLPGGDDAAMARTLRRLALLPPGTVVLPGHGPATTIADELRDNPYLRTARHDRSDRT